MKPSASEYVTIRGLRHHVRMWGDPGHPKLFLLHGWMDVSASFQFLVDELRGDWHVIAPDWRGFGCSEWAAEGYWFPDYLADLEALLDAFSPHAPVRLLGHSMGGNVAGLYAGIRPERISRLVLAEGFGMRPSQPEDAPDRYAKWLRQVPAPAAFRAYASLEEVADRLKRNSPRLSDERARLLAPHWALQRPDGAWVPAADPRHKTVNPLLYRQDEALACWRRITAPVLWVWGGDPAWMRDFAGDDAEDWRRRRGAIARLTECRIPGSGHMMHLENPVRLAREVEPFLVGA